RRPFFFMFLIAMALAFYCARWVVDSPRRRALVLSLLLFGCSIPLLVGGSIQAQLDGSWGVLLCALAAALLLTAANSSGWKAQVLSAIGGFAGAIGKNEWILTLLAAALAAIGAQFVFDWITGKQTERPHTTIALGIGILLGAALSYSL